MILDKAAAVLKKDFLMSSRYRNGVLMNFISPILQLALFYYLSRAVGPQFRPEGMSYFLFLLIGTGFYTFLLTGMHSFFRIIQESQQAGTLEVLMTTSTPAPVLLSLSAVSAFAGGLIQLAIYVGGGLVLFHPPIRINAVAGALVFIFSSVIAVAIGMIAAGVQVAIHKGSAALWLFGSSAWVLAGTIFPVSVLPHPAQLLSQLLPLTHALTGMRLAVAGSGNSVPLTREILALGLFCALLIPSGLWFFSWTVRRARQFGTLSFY